MFGLILIATSSLLGEISSSLGKVEVKKKEESIYTMAFLSLFWGAIWFLGLIIFKNGFIFSLASLPLFITRAILEIAQAHMSVLAITQAERSTYSFVRISTMVMLPIVDIFLGYSISAFQVAGIFFIGFVLLIVFMNHGIDKKGLSYVIYTAIGAVATVSLFKYNITHFNSIETEQFLMHVILMIYFFIMATQLKKENPIMFLLNPLFFGQSFSSGLGSVLGSFAYGFAPASIIMAGERSTSVLFSLISGKVYFREKHIIFKLFIFMLIAIGIFLLSLS